LSGHISLAGALELAEIDEGLDTIAIGEFGEKAETSTETGAELSTDAL
jgi:hypothetical protein